MILQTRKLFYLKKNKNISPSLKIWSLNGRLADRKKEKAKREADCLKRQQEKEAKQKIYQAKKDKRYKTLKAKNKRGQPLMGGRIELLLEKIQESMTW